MGKKPHPATREYYDQLIAEVAAGRYVDGQTADAAMRFAAFHGDDAEIRKFALAYHLHRRRTLTAAGRDLEAWAAKPPPKGGPAAICALANRYADARRRKEGVDEAWEAFHVAVMRWRTYFEKQAARKAAA